jgi:hypothetical protein
MMGSFPRRESRRFAESQRQLVHNARIRLEDKP